MNTLYLFWAIIALQFADLALTIDILLDGGREVAPIGRLFKWIGQDEALFLGKGIALGVFLYAHGNDLMQPWAYWFILVLYVAVVGNNLVQRRKQAKR
ncbi:MAG: hypothetical protein Q8P46_18675 [Hyphomicrobiales bacterium]|nr:hypothetical protein [Hyphomicrobiales bacterium]